MDEFLKPLKLTLQRFGALRPEAWERIVSGLQVANIKVQMRCNVPKGAFAYVAEGLLKECDIQQRESPSILNFLAKGQFFYSYAQANRIYTEAIMPSTVLYMEKAALRNLLCEFNELDSIYLTLCCQYDELRLLKIMLLEMPVLKRIEVFRLFYQPILPYLKKQNMANYLHLHYTHFVRIWNSL